MNAAHRISFTPEQIERLSAAFTKVQRGWGRDENRDSVRFGARGMRGEVKGLTGSADALFAQVGATVKMRYLVPQRRGAPADTLLLTGELGDNVVFMANAKPAGDNAVDVEITLYPAPESNQDNSSGQIADSDFLFRVLSALGGDSLQEAEVFVQFVSQWLATPGVNRKAFLAGVSALVTEELALSA